MGGGDDDDAIELFALEEGVAVGSYLARINVARVRSYQSD